MSTLPNANADAHAHISNYLMNTKSLPVAETWLTQLLSSQRVGTTPLSALTQTALFRLLASDFTTSLSITETTPTPSQRAHHLLPVDISDPAVKERRVPGPVPVQVLDIEDIGTSAWSQVEAIESVERGEETRGREIIRTVVRDEVGDTSLGNAVDGSGSNNNNALAGRNASTTTSNGPHKLMLQDAQGTTVVAIELKRIEAIGIGKMSIGTKIVLSNATVGRGMLLLEPTSVVILGGRIEHLDRRFKEGRKARLLAKIAEAETDD